MRYTVAKSVLFVIVSASLTMTTTLYFSCFFTIMKFERVSLTPSLRHQQNSQSASRFPLRSFETWLTTSLAPEVKILFMATQCSSIFSGRLI